MCIRDRATAYVLIELVGIEDRRKTQLFRATAIAVVLIGMIISISGKRPLELILVAQYANGLLLPIVATFLLYVMNRRSLLGEFVNSTLSNVAGIFVVLVTFGLGVRAILYASGVL